MISEKEDTKPKEATGERKEVSKCEFCTKPIFIEVVNHMGKFCSMHCRDQWKFAWINKYTVSSLKKIQSSDYSFERYSPVAGLSLLSKLFSSLYLFSSFEAFRRLINNDSILDTMSTLPDETTIPKSSTGSKFNNENLMMVLHNLVQILQNGSGSDHLNKYYPLVETFGFINALWYSIPEKITNSVIPELEKQEFKVQFHYFALMLFAVALLKFSYPDVDPDSDDPKEAQIRNDERIIECLKTAFYDEARDERYIRLGRILPGTEPRDAIASVLTLSPCKISQIDLKVWVGGSFEVHIPLVTGHKAFKPTTIARIKEILTQQFSLNYPFLLLFELDLVLSTKHDFAKDKDNAKDFVKMGGKLYTSKWISASKPPTDSFSQVTTLKIKLDKLRIFYSYLSTETPAKIVEAINNDFALLESDLSARITQKDLDLNPGLKKIVLSRLNLQDLAYFNNEGKDQDIGQLYSFDLQRHHSTQSQNLKPEVRHRDVGYTADEILSAVLDLEDLEKLYKTQKPKNWTDNDRREENEDGEEMDDAGEDEEDNTPVGPKFLILKTLGVLNKAFATTLLRSIRNSRVLLMGRENKMLRIRGFEICHPGESVECFINTEEFDDMYQNDAQWNVAGNRCGKMLMKCDQIQVNLVSTIVYELIDVPSE